MNIAGALANIRLMTLEFIHALVDTKDLAKNIVEQADREQAFHHGDHVDGPG